MTQTPVTHAAHVRGDLSIDQQHALKTAASRLHTDYGEHFGVETIERFLHSSYDQFAGRATIPTFLPLLAERFARQRLNALARVEGKITEGAVPPDADTGYFARCLASPTRLHPIGWI